MGTRQQIISALKARLQTIKVANGYNTNAGDRVFLWRQVAMKPGETLLLNIKYAAEKDNIDGEGLSGPYNVWNRALPIGITIAQRDTLLLDDLEDIIADVWKAIGIDDTFGGLAIYSNAIGDMIVEEQEEDAITGAILTLTIAYRTKMYET